jgi:hypothetical protein
MVIAIICWASISPIAFAENHELKFSIPQSMKTHWIQVQNEQQPNFHHTCYRKTFELTEVPSKAMLHIAAGRLYKLYINGKFVMYGPARSTFNYRFVDQFDIASYLKAGKNILAVELVYLPVKLEEVPISEYDYCEPGFSLFLDIKPAFQEQSIVANRDWRYKNWLAHHQEAILLRGFRSEVVETGRIDWNWKGLDYNDQHWDTVAEAGKVIDAPTLKPRPIALPELSVVMPRKIADLGVVVLPDSLQEIEPQDLRHSAMRWAKTGKVLLPNTIKALDRVQVRQAGRFISGGGNCVKNAGSLLCRERGSAKLLGTEEGSPYLLLDFRETVSGLFEVTANIPKGVKLQVSYLEWLDRENGAPARHNYRLCAGGQRGGFTLIGSGQEVNFQTFHHFSARYLCLIPRNLKPGQEVEIKRVAATQICSLPVRTRADVICSDPKLNRLVDAAKNTIRILTPDYYVDCSSSERKAYIGGTFWMAKTGYVFYGDTEIMGVMLDTVSEYHGKMEKWPYLFDGATFSAQHNWVLWESVFEYIFDVFDHARYTGNPVPDHLVDNISLMVEDMDQHVGSEGLLESPPQSFNWCDWSKVAIGAHPNPEGVSIANNAMFYKALVLLHEHTSDEKYREKTDKLRGALRNLANPYIDTTAIRSERLVPDLFVRKDNKLVPVRIPEAWNFADFARNGGHKSEATQYWLLWSGVLDTVRSDRLWQVLRNWRVNECQRRDDVRLIAVVRASMPAIWQRILFALDRRDSTVVYRDMHDVFDLMLDHGDSLWEVISEDSRVNAHSYGPYAGAVIFECLTGIQPGPKGGYKHCLIAPLIDDSLEWARGYMEIEEGTIGVNWQRDADSFLMTVALPQGVTAEVLLPPEALKICHRGGHKVEGAGRYLINSTTEFRISLHNGLNIESKGVCKNK